MSRPYCRGIAAVVRGAGRGWEGPGRTSRRSSSHPLRELLVDVALVLLLGVVLGVGVLLVGCTPASTADHGPRRDAAAPGRLHARYLGKVAGCADCPPQRWDLTLFAPARGDPRDRQTGRFALLREPAPSEGHTDEIQGRWSAGLPETVGIRRLVYRLQPDDGTPPLTLLRFNEQQLRPLVDGIVAAPLQRVAVSRQADTLDVVARDAREPVLLHPGQLLRVHLLDSPATGSGWELAAAVPSALRLEADPGLGPVETPAAALPRTWSFRVLGPGTARLRFDHRRDWQRDGAGLETIGFDLRIR